MGGAVSSGIKRDSNIELLRVLCMLLLIAHHLVVHGGVIGLEGMPNNRIIALLVLPAGKICFNCFVAISTWYLVRSSVRGIKFIKVWLQVLFYNLLMLGLTVALGQELGENVTWRQWLGACFPILGNSHGYAASYLAFYLLVPFLKLLAERINKRQNGFLILLLALTQLLTVPFGYIIQYTQPMSSEILLFVLCFFISRYLQEYPIKLQGNRLILALIVAVCWGGTGLCRILSAGSANPTVVEVASFFANIMTGSELSVINVLGGYALFLLFYNTHLSASRGINRLATTTFGILLLHDHNYFRPVVWQKLVRVSQWSGGPTLAFLRNMIIATLGIFAIGALLDLIRQKLLEGPVLKIRPVNAAARWIDTYLSGERKEGDI